MYDNWFCGVIMNENKCKKCKNYDNFFNSCKLYFEEVYIGEGDFDIMPTPIKNVSNRECKYEH